MADLEGIAHRKGVRIVDVERLRHQGWAEYDHRHQAIYVRADLGPVQRRSVIAHELGHVHYGHRHHRQKHELQADRYAAWLLIAPADWAHATAAHSELLTVAAELQVLPRLAAVYARDLARHPA